MWFIIHTIIHNDINYIFILLLTYHYLLIKSLLGCRRSFLDNLPSLSRAAALVRITCWGKILLLDPLSEVGRCSLLRISLILVVLSHLWISLALVFSKVVPWWHVWSLGTQITCQDHLLPPPLFPGAHVLPWATPFHSAGAVGISTRPRASTICVFRSYHLSLMYFIK